MYRIWVGPVIVSVILLTAIRLTDLAESPRLNFFGNPVDPDLSSPLGRILSSAAEGARRSEWDHGSAVVLSNLASCIERAGEQIPPGASAPVPPSSPDPLPPPAASGEGFPPPSAGAEPEVSGFHYYRTICLRLFSTPSWTSFEWAYGRRPGAWTLQSLALAERVHDARRAAGASDSASWATAFGSVPAALRDLRETLQSVYPAPVADPADLPDLP